MYLVIENTKKSFSFPASKTLLVGNDFDCDIQINHPKIWGRHFAITQHNYGCVLQVYNDRVKVNADWVKEQCLLDTGDVLQVDDLRFRLLDDEYIPKDSSINHTNITINENTNESSVYGIRSFAADSMGRFIIDDYHHQDGWHVFRQNNELHFIDNKQTTYLNGLPIAQANLSNGDVISNEVYKYKIELPGTSGFSKFSPSHPRNVQLSEAMLEPSAPAEPTDQTGPKWGFLKKNLWWLTLLLGLVVLILVIMSNPNR